MIPDDLYDAREMNHLRSLLQRTDRWTFEQDEWPLEARDRARTRACEWRAGGGA